LKKVLIFRLLGKVALVSGGASGIGESIVSLFLKHGAKDCVADIQDDMGQRLCNNLDEPHNVTFSHCNVTIEDDVKRAVDHVVDKFGSLDIMVNNAGILEQSAWTYVNLNSPTSSECSM
ncbi:zerumbone synthase, partial [Phtheirospermum japonicum]